MIPSRNQSYDMMNTMQGSNFGEMNFNRQDSFPSQPSQSRVWNQPQQRRRAPGLSPRGGGTLSDNILIREGTENVREQQTICEIPKRFEVSPGQQYEVDASTFFVNSRAKNPGSAMIEDSNWLTVFGFPQSAVENVRKNLEQQLNCNLVIRTTDGNYMHVETPTLDLYHRCLSLNNQMLFGNTIIGVFPCREITEADEPLRTSVSVPRFNKYLAWILDFLYDV